MKAFHSFFTLCVWLRGTDTVRTQSPTNTSQSSLILVALLLVSLALAGCGGGGGGGSDDTDNTNTGNNSGNGGGSNVEAVDRSNISLVGNLLAKEEAGEWTRGEGLVASLQLLAGEKDASDVQRQSDLINHEATGIVAMANDYLEDGPDADAKAEISRLLDLIVYSNERLEAMAGLATLPAAIVSVDPITECSAFFGNDEAGVGKCLDVQSVTISGKNYRVFKPAPPLPTAGWTQQHYDYTVNALQDSVPVLSGLGNMPDANLVFFVIDGPNYAVAVPHLGGTCYIAIYKGMQALGEADFKQVVAHELAHCFQIETFVEQSKVPYEIVKWRDEGMAEYLSDVVYPNNNLEWRDWLTTLQQEELKTTLFDRDYENVFFFQYLAQRLGKSGLFNVINALPGPGVGTGILDQVIAMSNYPDMDNLYQDFAKALTDKDVLDSSFASVPYVISEVNQPTREITGPIRYVEDLQPFEVRRYRIHIASDKEADLSFNDEGALRDSTRRENNTIWDDPPANLKGDKCEPGLVQVATATTAAVYDVEITDVRDLPGSGSQGGAVSCDIASTWIVDNDSLDLGSSTHSVDYIQGQVRAIFHSDGVFEIFYDDFEYRVSQDVVLNVGGFEVNRHDEFTYTTNAHGTTSYEVDGNRITYGTFSGSSYLDGTRTTRHIRTFDPKGVVLPGDLDETTTNDAGGLSMFAGLVNFDLLSDGSVLQLRFLEKIQGRLNRSGDAQVP